MTRFDVEGAVAQHYKIQEEIGNLRKEDSLIKEAVIKWALEENHPQALNINWNFLLLKRAWSNRPK